MTLVTAKDPKVESSLVPESGSPSTLESQNLTRYQKLADKTTNGGEVSLDTEQKQRIFTVAQGSGVNEPDEQLEDKSSHPGATVSPVRPHAELAESTPARSPSMTSGSDTLGYPVCSTEHTQTPSTAASAPPQQQQQQPNVQEIVNAPGTPSHSLESSIETGTINNPPSFPSSSTNGQPLVNGKSAPPIPSSIFPASTASNAPSIPSSPSHLNSVQQATPTEDVNMSANVHNTRGSHNTVDEDEPLSRRTRSRRKRPPNSLSKEPAKRARTSLDTTTEGRSMSAVYINGKLSADVEMHDPSPVPMGESGPSIQPQKSPILTSAMESHGPPPEPPQSQMTNANLDPNLDPALTSSGSTSISTVPGALGDAPNQPSFSDDKPSNSSSTISEQPRPDSDPSSSLANNPYLALSTAFLKGATGSGGTGFNPYALYYGPGTPITPHTPTYSYPYIYHLPSPITPQAMYPASPSFPSPPTSQKSPPAASTSNGESQRQKPKRLKAHTVTSGNHNIPIVPRDKKGKPMLPLNVGIMTVIRLGEVCMREHFHTERYIFPVGYEVTRRYLSTIDPNSEVVYHCTILDGGDGPKFQIVPSDAPDKIVIAGTATGAWSNIVKQANAIRSRQHSNSVSGPDFFGLGQNTIKHLIQELPNADRLRDYVWQNFIEGGPLGGRHAAVTPALPEDYDSTQPIGALYPSERERLRQEVNLSPRGLSYYPQHIIAQAEAQRKQQSEPNAPVLDVSLLQASAVGPPSTSAPGANGHISESTLLSGQPSTTPGLTQPQATPPVPPTPDMNSQSSSTPVPTTIAGIMSAYPVPTPPPASAPAQASPAPTPSQSS
ncbi:hypothetical protein D9756_005101 [Leucocoprinus leucothites]|uniref:Transforming growth factor beta regulator 1 n=1 Tax=Leucocoprinus leucothites TaxID=201217 RepID=A0A8H5GA98_9AGAR|nr:hypothetical protein D9756_005101 [Leucoagaricus leucothites]